MCNLGISVLAASWAEVASALRLTLQSPHSEKTGEGNTLHHIQMSSCLFKAWCWYDTVRSADRYSVNILQQIMCICALCSKARSSKLNSFP